MMVQEATCDSCGRIYTSPAKRHYCGHCDKYYYICSSCEERRAKCRYCNIPLQRKREPLAPLRRRAVTV